MTVQSIKRAGAQSDQRRENMELWVEWLLTPAGERRLKTRKAVAEDMGVTTQSLRNYSRDPWVQSEMAKRGRAINKVERAGEVVDNLFQIAVGKNEEATPAAQVSAARAFLEYTNQVVSELSPQDLQDMSFDELRSVIDDLERAVLD